MSILHCDLVLKLSFVKESIYRVLAAVIHLGNVSFAAEVKDNVEVAAVQAKQELSIVAGLLVHPL